MEDAAGSVAGSDMGGFLSGTLASSPSEEDASLLLGAFLLAATH